MKNFFLTFLILSFTFFLFAQDSGLDFDFNDFEKNEIDLENLNAEGEGSAGSKNVEKEKSEKKNSFESLPSSYREISLGMDIETVKEILKNDLLFGYRGERDLSLLPTRNRSAIETAGNSFISRSWFQFYEEKLYTMIFKLNTDKVDYYSIYSHFCDCYGEPQLLNPKRAVWENENIRLVIERPLSIKYIDLTVFNKILEESTTEKTQIEVRREEFINEF